MDNEKLWKKYDKEKNPIEKNRLRNEIIERYIDLVKIISGKMFNYYAKNIEYEDLVGYGVIGLIDAIDKFDIDKNIKFETYASIRIKGSIIDQIRTIDWVPRSIRQKSKNLLRVTERLEDRYGRSPTNIELARELKISMDELNSLQMECSTYNIISVEDQIMENYKFDLMDERKDNLPEENIVEKDAINNLKNAIDTLKDREKLIINLYYYENLTYREISEVVGISESRISQIISQCLEKLRKKLGN